MSHGLGDWYDIGPDPPGPAQLTRKALTATAIYLEDNQKLARIAAHFGRDADVRRYEAAARRIAAAFNRELFDPEAGLYATGSQTAQAMPLVLGIVPEGHEQRVLEALIADIRAHGNGNTAGDLGYRYVLRALAEAGRSDVIYDINHQQERPGYGYQLARGATSLTEAWDANPRSSQNHFMLGQIVEWLYADLAGLAPDPAVPGFGRVRVRPQPVPGIAWARASHRSPRGPVSVAWEREDAAFRLEVTLPPNTTGVVWIPAARAADVREGGEELGDASGVQLLRAEAGRVVLEVGSGRYVFRSSTPAGAPGIAAEPGDRAAPGLDGAWEEAPERPRRCSRQLASRTPLLVGDRQAEARAAEDGDSRFSRLLCRAANGPRPRRSGTRGWRAGPPWPGSRPRSSR